MCGTFSGSSSKFLHDHGERFRQVDVLISFLCFIAFFITVCYHTTYARPWIYAPLALYGLDLLMRMVKTRIQGAFLIPADRQMTLVSSKV